MRRLKRLERRVAQLEEQIAAIATLKVVSDAPVNQLIAAQTNTGLPVKSGPTSGEVDLRAGVIRLR